MSSTTYAENKAPKSMYEYPQYIKDMGKATKPVMFRLLNFTKGHKVNGSNVVYGPRIVHASEEEIMHKDTNEALLIGNYVSEQTREADMIEFSRQNGTLIVQPHQKNLLIRLRASNYCKSNPHRLKTGYKTYWEEVDTEYEDIKTLIREQFIDNTRLIIRKIKKGSEPFNKICKEFKINPHMGDTSIRKMMRNAVENNLEQVLESIASPETLGMKMMWHLVYHKVIRFDEEKMMWGYYNTMHKIVEVDPEQDEIQAFVKFITTKGSEKVVTALKKKLREHNLNY